MKSLSSPASLLLAAVMLSGCAFGNRHLTLKYENAAMAKAARPHVVAVQTFDEHRDRTEVGRVRNGYGMVTAKVHADGQSVGAWVADALASELAAAGCKVVRNGSAPASVGGTVTDAFADVYFSIKSNVDATITVRRGGSVVLQKNYVGEGSKTAWTASASEYSKGLTRALQDLMRQAVPDILKALE